MPDRSRRLPTLQDVAREAGVSPATVDRAINDRTGISARARAKVEAAMQRLDYRPNLHASRLARAKEWRICLVLPTGTNPFMTRLEHEARSAADHFASDRVQIDIAKTDVFSGPDLAAALERAAGTADAVAAVALDHPAVNEAINALVRQGKQVATLVSDAPRSLRQHYVGIDNVAAGRTAAAILGRFLGDRQGTVGVIAGSLLLRDHAERQLGFQQVMQDEFPHLAVLPAREGMDDRHRVAEKTREILKTTDDLIGLYNVGAGNEGAITVMTNFGVADQVVFVAHELTDASRPSVIDGSIDAIISQDAGHEVRSAFRRLVAALDGVPISDAQERIRIDIYLRHNLP